MADWQPLKLDAKLFQNVDETALRRAHATIENGFITEAQGFSRWPGVEEWASLPADGRIYLTTWRDDLVAVGDSGRVLSLDQAGTTTDRTEVPLSGGLRPTFTPTKDYLVAAAGGPLIGHDGKRTFALSDDAPIATHVGEIDGILIANERDSDRFFYSAPSDVRAWSPLDVLVAAGSADNATALIVTPFREILVAGAQSVEQFERLSSGDPPFFRRWSVGKGLAHPYTLCFADNAAWGVTPDAEMARFSGQISSSQSDDIGLTLTKITDWTDSWASELMVKGQKFIALFAPRALTPYGTQGLALLFDYRAKRWTSLYGWDDAAGVPASYPIWSVARIWNQTFLGGVGKIYRVTENAHWLNGRTMRMLVRTAHLSDQGERRLNNVRLRVKRGVGTYTTEPRIRLRANRDNRGWTPWASKGLGKSGERDMFIEFGGFGCGTSWQFELEVTDDCPVEIAGVDVDQTKIG